MNGIFAVHKPTGPTSQDIVSKLKHLFTKSPHFTPEPTGNKRNRRNKFIKIGHGGTLDPLADGVLVIGVGSGTKQLADYLGKCTKVYQATALLGCSTTTYDSEGLVHQFGQKDPKEVTEEQLKSAVQQFKGEILQTPPVYSALKMDGKPLYEYARENKPLPRPIEKRHCEILELSAKIVEGGETALPQELAGENERAFISNVQKNEVHKDKENANKAENENENENEETVSNGDAADITGINREVGVTVELKFSVSSGTYIRSLIHDLGEALGTKAHMTKLTRIQQGEWELGRNVIPMSVFDGDWWPTVETVLKEGPKQVLEVAGDQSQVVNSDKTEKQD